MPCCAFAAAILGQLILALGAVKRVILGGSASDATARNAAVEWRLDSPTAGVPPPPRYAWLKSRRAIGGLAFAAAIEIVIVIGAVYGFVEHRGHGATHHEHTEVQP